MNIQGEDRTTTTSCNWEKIRELGQGGFGNVCLYRNTTNDEYIAVKKLLLRPEFADIANRVWERWNQEVLILKKLDHNCVIKAIDVPPELDDPEFPALGMEYCTDGDLRKLLSRPENCNGLREMYVRDLLDCMGSAIEYLHSKRIIHRDLKPENIVLQPTEKEDKFLYKIIDLGYAKELDASSSCMLSHVGTQQYLAPELNGKKGYTRTVDYWSFGSVVFECITGRRPFLPDLRSSVQWHTEVSKKSPEDITAFHDERGRVKFSKEIPGTTRLCWPLKNWIEQWLKLMLRWDSKSRGGGIKTINNVERPKCFCVLEQILETKILHVLFAKANLLLSFFVKDTHTIEMIKQAIETKIKIPVLDQLLINRNGAVLQPHQLAMDACQESNAENPPVFLFCCDPIPDGISKEDIVPSLVEIIIKEPQTVLPFERHKKVWKNVVYFCAIVNHAHKRLVTSSKTAMKALLHTYTILVKQKALLKEEMIKLMAVKEYFKLSVSIDIQQLNSSLSQGTSGDTYRDWLQSLNEAENIDVLDHQVDDLCRNTEEHMQAVMELQKDSTNLTKDPRRLEDCEKEAKNHYESLRSVRVGHETLEHEPMVDIIGKCIVARNELTKSLNDSTDKVVELFHRLKLRQPEFESLSNAIQNMKQRLISLQRQRQEDVWKRTGDTPNMQSLNLTADTSIALTSMPWNGNETFLRSMSDPMESIRLMDNGKTNIQKMDDMLESMERDHEQSMQFFSSVGN